jgi:SPP1 family predicted phage head-tail adaptor
VLGFGEAALMRAGNLNKRVVFESAQSSDDAGGGNVVTWTNFATVWGGFSPERGRERLEAGRVEGASMGVLRVRSSSQTRQITTAYRVKIDGVPYNIRSIENPDQRNRGLEMLVEKGVAT